MDGGNSAELVRLLNDRRIDAIEDDIGRMRGDIANMTRMMEKVSEAMETIARLDATLVAHARHESEHNDDLRRVHDRIDETDDEVADCAKILHEQHGAIKIAVWVIPGLLSLGLVILTTFTTMRFGPIDEAVKIMTDNKTAITLMQRDFEALKRQEDIDHGRLK